MRQRYGVACSVLFAASAASLAAMNQNTLAHLIPGRISINASKVRSGTLARTFCVQGIDFNIYEDPQGVQKIGVLNP